MYKQDELARIRSTCDGIRRLYFARRAGIEKLQEERDRVAREARDLRARRQREQDSSQRQQLGREISLHVDALSDIYIQIGRRQARLDDYLNDYRLNQCSGLTGPLN